MEIKNKEGQIRIKFSKFKKPYIGEPVFVDMLVEVLLNNASAQEVITVELLDLEGFLQNLKRLNETLTQTFYFQPIDEQFLLKFEPLISGNILVTGFLKDKQYINSLQFSFEVPPTELTNIIWQVESTIDKLI